jgi:hypothetical protein
MKRNAYVLIFLAFWAPFDDALLTAASAFQSAPLTSDDDEALPLAPLTQQEHFARRPPQPLIGRPLATSVSPVRRSVPSGWNLTTPLTSPPLDTFISLRI